MACKLHMVASASLSEVLLKLSNRAASSLIADTGSGDLHRPTSDREGARLVRFVGVHAASHVLFIKCISEAIHSSRHADPAASLLNVSVGDFD